MKRLRSLPKIFDLGFRQCYARHDMLHAWWRSWDRAICVGESAVAKLARDAHPEREAFLNAGLGLACARGLAGIVPILLGAGATSCGATFLNHAPEDSRPSLATAFADCGKHAPHLADGIVLDAVCRWGTIDQLSELLDAKSITLRRSLVRACAHARNDLVEMLLNRGATPDWQILQAALSSCNATVCDTLIAYGCGEKMCESCRFVYTSEQILVTLAAIAKRGKRTWPLRCVMYGACPIAYVGLAQELDTYIILNYGVWEISPYPRAFAHACHAGCFELARWSWRLLDSSERKKTLASCSRAQRVLLHVHDQCALDMLAEGSEMRCDERMRIARALLRRRATCSPDLLMSATRHPSKDMLLCLIVRQRPQVMMHCGDDDDLHKAVGQKHAMHRIASLVAAGDITKLNLRSRLLADRVAKHVAMFKRKNSMCRRARPRAIEITTAGVVSSPPPMPA